MVWLFTMSFTKLKYSLPSDLHLRLGSESREISVPNSKMGVWVVNETGESLTIQDFFITNASTGSGYDGDVKYELPHKGRELLGNSIFTDETIKERKPIEVHIKIVGKELLILHHDVFEKNKAIIFVIDKDKKATFNHVPKRTASAKGFADSIWRMIPSCGPAESNIEALIAAAKPCGDPVSLTGRSLEAYHIV